MCDLSIQGVAWRAALLRTRTKYGACFSLLPVWGNPGSITSCIIFRRGSCKATTAIRLSVSLFALELGTQPAGPCDWTCPSGYSFNLELSLTGRLISPRGITGLITKYSSLLISDLS
ncbi:hypothetical protein BRADI_2g07278v3 [Brachypodium distachyon]|uniref:Uncharacterized protein n=1 Tax=Brachypodium distachyon TaxID=15368 RepID=A0A0Q3IBT6_BRADI|nr:hypothetical protein BRADI_2g07278v3 [Brachypodium distachyon]PNT70181.1 hypothetical protein BRADI_2g07278v3 [Brachypodium distachyon]